MKTPLKSSLSRNILVVSAIYFLTFFNVFSQDNKAYNDLWIEIEELKRDGLTKSAIEKTTELIQKAKKDNLDAQFIKGQIYRMYFRSLKEEEAIIASLFEMEDEINNSEGSTRAILHSAIAEMYWWYYSAKRWELSKRIPTNDANSNDIRDWDSRKFIEVIHHHYQASIKINDGIKKVKSSEYDLIWANGEDSQNISPYLFDVLIRRALDFYTNHISGLTIARDQLYVDDNKYFVSANSFVELKIKPTEFISFDRISLQLFQAILAFHIDENNQDATAFYDLSRLEYLYSKYLFSDRDSLYETALISAHQFFSSSDISSEFAFALANHFNRLANRYHYKNLPEYRWFNKTAIEWCERSIKEHPNSRGAQMSANLIESIKEMTFSIELENVNYPGKPIPYAIDFKNTSKLYFRLYDNSENILVKNGGRNRDQNVQYFLDKKVIRSWDNALIDSLDHQSHSMEFFMPKLEHGHFVLLASEDPDFKTVENNLSLNFFWVSELAYLFHQDKDGGAKIMVTNRQNGKPLRGIRANYYKERYNHTKRQTDLIAVGEIFSDANGLIAMPNSEEQRNYSVLLSKGKDSLMISNSIYIRKPNSTDQKSNYSTSLFTDRTIYRPGQTVYYKGLVLEKKSNQEVELVKDKEVTIKLMDMNSKEVARLDAITSEFGSYSGTFFLPTSTLTGRFFLDDGISRQAIYIEEYKRPSFLVELEEIRENSRLGETVTIRGIAKSFNDVPLNNAKGSFNIQRYVRMAIPYFGYGYIPNHKAEIAFGDFVTDQDGKFEISFEALPDKALPADNLPIFQFTADIMVSDLNGESQQVEKTVPIGYHSLNLNMALSNQLEKSSLDSIRIFTQNLSGYFTPSEVEIIVSALTPPKQTIKKMLWNTPDYTIAKNKKVASSIMYNDEKLMEQWPIKQTVFSKRITTSESKRVGVRELSKLPSGPYEFLLKSKDPYGKEVTWAERISIFNKADKKVPIPVSSWAFLEKSTCKVGEEIVLHLGSNNPQSFVYYSISNKDGIFKEDWLTINESMQDIRVRVQEKDRGGLSIQTTTVADGRSNIESFYVDVPFDNKELQVQLKTVRDNIRPGDKETWSFEISNKEGKELNSEVLVSMYDASLDKLRNFNWRFYPYYYSIPRIYWNHGDNFSSSRSRIYPFKQRNDRYIKPRTFDRLNWFGFSYFGGLRQYAAANEPMADMDNAMAEKAAPLAKEPETKEEQSFSGLEKDTQGQKEKIRSDFRETAFYYPNLKSNDSGIVEFSFEVPDALTKWKLQVLAHTEDLKYRLISKDISSTKELMVVPNYPRFLTAGDTLLFSSKISNLTSDHLNIEVELKISDALNNQTLKDVIISEPIRKVDVAGKSNGVVQWKITTQKEAGLLNFAVYAKSAFHNDGEVRSIPVLSEEILITETYPVSLRAKSKKLVQIDKLSESHIKQGIRPQRLTVEFTTNPAWYVVQALPYIAQINNESTGQLFNRYYANSIGQFIMNSNERFRSVIELWGKTSQEAFLSALEKNEELKQTVLSETPWLLEGKSESEDKKEMALFFDKNNLNNSLSSALYELIESQSPNGGWPWFKGMPDNRFITQNIVLSMGRLNKMGVISINQNNRLRNSLASAVNYLDQRIDEEYRKILAKAKKPEDNYLSPLHIQYLFMRSYFSEVPMVKKHEEAFNYFTNQCEKHWLRQSNYSKAMIALTFNRNDETELPNKIMASLRENALHSDEFGMYWKIENSYYWYNSKIESQALLIEAFSELSYNEMEVEELKIFLLKQKQTKRWRTGRASVEACYSLLLKGIDNVSEGNTVALEVGDESFEINASINAEAGTGYYKNSWEVNEIDAKMREIKAENKGSSISWGAAYYQFFQDADKVEASKTGLSVERLFYVKKYTNQGEVLQKIEKETFLNRGDIVVVKLLIKSDRDLDFVSLKDMRAAGLEPMQSLSGHQYFGNLGYYLSIKDASHNFYFNRINKGSYTLNYELKASNSGVFSSGVSTIQSFYSPEFSSHSKGRKIEIH